MSFMKYPFLSILATTTILSGCSFGPEKPPGFPDVYSCSITLTQNGQSVGEGAMIQLLPTDGQKDWGTIGITDADGSIEPYTYGKWKGVPKGKFKITAVKHVKDDKNRVFSVINKIFADPEQTTISIEVGDNDSMFTFDLGAPVSERVIID